MHSISRHEKKASGQLHASVALFQEKESSINWNGGCVGLRAGVESVGKRRVFAEN